MAYVPRKYKRNSWEAEARKPRDYPKELMKVYNSKLWRNISKRNLAKHPECIECGRRAEVTDHIIPIRFGGAKFSRKNLQSMCHSCHSKKTTQERDAPITRWRMHKGEKIPEDA